jgi:hypothetical protein
MDSEFHLVSMDKVSIKTVNEQIKSEIRQLRDIYHNTSHNLPIL